MEKKRKVNKYAEKALPQAVLDYHTLGSLTPDQIREKAFRFLSEAREQGRGTVSILVGKGLHSQNGPVVGPVLRSYIPTLSFVKSCEDAPYTRGGSGALEVKFF